MCLTKYMPEMGYLGENSIFFPSNTDKYVQNLQILQAIFSIFYNLLSPNLSIL